MSGMESKTFLYNSGSIIPNILTGQLSSIFFIILLLIFRNQMRKKYVVLGISLFMAPPFLNFTIQLLYQFATDATISTLLQCKAYNELGVMTFLEYHYIEYINLSFTVVFLVSGIAVVLYGIFKVQFTKDLTSQEFLRGNKLFVEGLNIKTKLSAQYTNIKILRRIVISIILIFMQSGCMQTQFLLQMSAFAIMLVVHAKPLEDKIA
jgi:hypothetical protein